MALASRDPVMVLTSINQSHGPGMHGGSIQHVVECRFGLDDGFVAGFLELIAFDCIHCSLFLSISSIYLLFLLLTEWRVHLSCFFC
jgi:hypothetical protein